MRKEGCLGVIMRPVSLKAQPMDNGTQQKMQIWLTKLMQLNTKILKVDTIDLNLKKLGIL